MPIENHFLYAGDQKVSETLAYNALNYDGGSNKAYIVNHTHRIESSDTLITNEGLTNNLFIGVPTGDSGRSTVWPNGSNNNNATTDNQNT